MAQPERGLSAGSERPVATSHVSGWAEVAQGPASVRSAGLAQGHDAGGAARAHPWARRPWPPSRVGRDESSALRAVGCGLPVT